MKDTKTCPKCKCSNIVRFDGYYAGFGVGNHIITSTFGAVNVNRYVCCDCGFSEEWIDKEDLATVANSEKAIR